MKNLITKEKLFVLVLKNTNYEKEINATLASTHRGLVKHPDAAVASAMIFRGFRRWLPPMGFGTTGMFVFA
jgi:hypothetical protein